MPVQYLPVSWSQYHSLAQSLAAKILDSKYKPDHIIAIARGGLTLGHILSDFLRIPIATITIQSYVDIQTQGSLIISEELRTPVKGKNVLLVDDVSDSGKTLIRAVAYLKEFDPSVIASATLFYKPHSEIKPDYYSQETTKWILFPYEPTEMILLIAQQMKKEGSSDPQIDKRIIDLGYTAKQIDFVRKYYFTHNNA